MFSSLSESGFIPTREASAWVASLTDDEFSSLSESGFIPTNDVMSWEGEPDIAVLISFREWLHSYLS